MRKLIVLCFGVAMSLIVLEVVASAQSKSVELTDVVDNLVRAAQEKFSQWEHTSGTPIEGSRDVAIEKWVLGEQLVVVVITRHQSEEEAIKRIRQFAEDMKASAVVPEAGEEAYSRGSRGTIVFRKRNFTINVDAKSTGDKEEKKLIKEFSRLVGNAMK
jgi:hypothetical protein